MTSIRSGADLADLRHLLLAGSQPADRVKTEGIYILSPPWADWDVVKRVETTGYYNDAKTALAAAALEGYAGMSFDPAEREKVHHRTMVNKMVAGAGLGKSEAAHP